MPTVLLGLAALVLVLWVLNGFAKTDANGLARGARIGRGLAAAFNAARGAFTAPNPTGFARGVRFAGGIVALALAGFLGARGQVLIAIPLAILAYALLGWLPGHIGLFGRSYRKSGGQVSRVRSAFLEMELDHDTGAMRGRVTAGRCAGAALDRLEVSTLIALQSEFDEESRALLAGYLDRRDPGWRKHAHDGAASGQGTAASTGKMSEQEAYQVLGLEPGATADEISRAHHALMKKLHPDQGGSTYLAARVNQAKDVLTRRHR
jgi:DnaJ domain